ncbi:alpha/beta hydrolase-fold protein [Tenacibaculum sp. FZY0031]|uniref:alpha/beta hydrolase n=1 Tax=unclassified Tenacibaculum TaxID=2635139 RepID=UPI002EA30DF1|nr:alpha/beta hydrolase-fold protein [Tenacibaculum sp. FZY0031]
MKQKTLVLATLFITIATFTQNIPKKMNEGDFSIGKTVQIKSTILKENRTLNIYFPASYDIDKSKKYPVIYLLDGSKDEDFIHIAGIVQFGSFPWINMLPETIVVGIGNVDRKRDFTYPSTLEIDQKEFPSSGKSKEFIQFLQKELLPFIDANYRTTNNKTLIGQSLGGLLATEVLFKTPNLFNNYIIVSPSLWWDAEKLLTFVPAKYNTKKHIYIAVGKEGPVMERTARELYDKLLHKAADNSKIYFDFLEDKTHGDALHEAVYNAFGSIYKSRK